MKKETGWITTFLMALAAIFGFSALPKAKAPDTSENQKAVSDNPAPLVVRADRRSIPDKLKNSPCWEIEKSLLIFLDQDGKTGKAAQQQKATIKTAAGKQKTEDRAKGQGKKEGQAQHKGQKEEPGHNQPDGGKAQDDENGHVGAPGSCFDDNKPLNPRQPISGDRVRFLVATLPDPVHTHFPLLFDRLTEALQQAAQDQGYNYDSSWLPWTPVAKGSSEEKTSEAELTRRADRQAQPGVLVFRKAIPAKSGSQPASPYDHGLIVFVVGENPTGGIDRDQLRNSFEWIDVLSGTDDQQSLDPADPNRARHKAGVLGPYFSGSLPSLYEALLRNQIVVTGSPPAQDSAAKKEDKSAPPIKTFAIFSGSVTSKAGIDWINARLKDTRARFFSFQQNDDNMIDNYCRYLRNQGYDTGRLAILSEDETAYGQSSDTATALPDCETAEKHGPLYVYYPRDIAALRSAHSQQQASGTSKSQSTSTPRLPLDLIEPEARERDTINTFGGQQTILSQEATLFGLANLFKFHEIQFIVLRTSNTLDQIFLTRFFSQADPGARLVLTSADLLFRRSSDTVGFRGTMTLTTYPLLTWQQDWTHWQSWESRHSHRAFPEDTTEGLYLAARFLIDGGGSGTEQGVIPNAAEMDSPLKLSNSAIKIQDYAPPSWLIQAGEPSQKCAVFPALGTSDASPTRPPTWLSVVGSGQIWPIAVLGSCIRNPEGPGRPFSIDMVSPSQTPDDTLPWANTDSKVHPSADLPFPLLMFLCCAVVLGWSVWHLFCCLFGSHVSALRFGKWKISPSSIRSLAYFAPVPRREHRWLIFIGCFLMWVIAVGIAASTGMYRPFALEHPGRVIMYCTLLGILPFASLIANYRTFLPPEWSRDELPNQSSRKLRHRLRRALTVHSVWSASRRFLNLLRRKVSHPGQKAEQGSPTSQSAVFRFDVPLMTVGAVLLAIAAFAFFWVFYGWIIPSLGPGAEAFSAWRSMNLSSGVSVTVPVLLLTAGLYGWFWYSLSGLALFNAGLPKLPHQTELLPTMPMFSREGPGKRIQNTAIPLRGTFARHFLTFAIAYCAFWWLAGEVTSIRALGPVVFGKVYALWFGLLIVLILTESWEMLRAWAELRELLNYLDRLPLRRTLQALGGISWGTVWKMSGNVLEQRYRLISRQIESLIHLENQLKAFEAKSFTRAQIVDHGNPAEGVDYTNIPSVQQKLSECDSSLWAFANWYSERYIDCQYGDRKGSIWEADLSPATDFQTKLASTAGVVLTRILIPAWFSESESLILEWPPAEKDKKFAPELPQGSYVKAAEEFFCLPYLGFIQNILGRIRTMTLAIIWLFLGATLSVASYPFDPRPVTSGIFVFVFLEVAAVMVFVYGQMHRDATLSHITNTNPGELGSDFWIKLITFGIGPVLGLITAAFPELTGFVTSWLQPAVGSIK